MDLAAKRKELTRLKIEAKRLELEIFEEELAAARDWPPKGFYFTYHALAGIVLGLFGAATSLVFNVAGSYLFTPPPPLKPDALNLIRVYLTFPMGESALTTSDGVAIVIGCCLYMCTGMVLGIPFQLAQTRFAPKANFIGRLALTTALATAIWIVNFYLVLSWLQPLLFGGDWIVRLIPWWVGLLTHLVFGWTMALAYPLGVFVPYQRIGEKA